MKQQRKDRKHKNSHAFKGQGSHPVIAAPQLRAVFQSVVNLSRPGPLGLARLLGQLRFPHFCGSTESPSHFQTHKISGLQVTPNSPPLSVKKKKQVMGCGPHSGDRLFLLLLLFCSEACQLQKARSKSHSYLTKNKGAQGRSATAVSRS